MTIRLTGLASAAILALLLPLQLGAQSDAASDLAPVTDSMLRDPIADDWLMWRRTYDGHGFSPLNQINRRTVDELQEAWRAPLQGGSNMATPLVHDGVMFLLTVPDTVLALNAATGEIIWQYQHELNGIQNPKIGLAVHGNTLFVPTSDMRMLALDNRTGELKWNTHITGPGRGPIPYALRSAPLVADGVVMQGVTATLVPQGGFIVGLDAESGEERWRFYTVARPGELGGDTWNNLPLEARSGGSVWIPGSYDPELDLAYFGAAPTYDTGPLLEALNFPGTSDDALFTNSTLALRPSTGALVWHFQHVANDQWDLDWIYERQIVELDVNGEQRKAIVTAGKMALFDAVDAATGDYLFSVDMGLQNVISAVDPVTGAKTINPATIPNAEDGRLVCPFANGGRNWQATAYNPRSSLLFVPLAEVCMQSSETGRPGQLLTSGMALTPVPTPDSDGKFGRLQAVNLQTQELVWDFREPVTPTSGLLATGGGLVFMGTLDNALKAFNDSTGELLWQGDLGDIPASFPVTYRVDGRQYIAVVVGQPSLHANIWLGFVAGALGADNPLAGLGRSGAAIVTYALD